MPVSSRPASGPTSGPSSGPASLEERDALRIRSLAWALIAAATALLIGAGQGVLQLGLAEAIEPALRSGGCGFFYGLLAFHLQRADPHDSHLAAGLVGAVSGFRSLTAATPLPTGVTEGLSTAMMELLRGWLPLWLPLVGSALLLRGVPRLLPTLRP